MACSSVRPPPTTHTTRPPSSSYARGHSPHAPGNLPHETHIINPPPPLTPRSVLFNFLGRDFFNALSAKDEVEFYQMLVKWVAALFLGIPVYVFR